MNQGTSLASVLLGQIDGGKTEFIPVLERGLELGLTQLSQHTGMFQGKNAQPLARAWRDYTTTSEAMKGRLRIVAYMGTENLPFRQQRADTLIAKQEWCRKGTISVKRNTAEMMVQCLLESSYRGDELLEALDAHSKVILDGEPEKSHMTGDYASYVIKMFGGMPGFGAVHIPEEPRKTLKEGKNTLTIRAVEKTGDLGVSAGLIDWK